MSRSWLTETIAQVDDLLNQINGLPDEVRLYLLDRLIPEPEPEVKPAKKTRKKASKSATKSPRGQSLSNAIQRTAKSRAGDSNNGDASGQCSDCGMTADMPIHDPDGGYLNYHPFVSAAAQPARGRSSTNGGAGSSIASSEAEPENVSTATGG